MSKVIKEIIEDEEKEPKPKYIIKGTFPIRVTDRKAKKSIIHSIKEDANHIRSMFLILENELYEQSKTSKELKKIYSLLKSKPVLRDVVYGRSGNDKTEKSIKYKKRMNTLRSYFVSHSLFNEFCDFSQKKIDPKNFVSILTNIKANFSTFFTSIKSYKENPSAYAKKMGNSGIPQPPKPKKLTRINNASLTLDRAMWSFCKETKKVTKEILVKNKKGALVKKTKQIKEIHYYIRVKVGKLSHKIPENWTKFKVPKEKIRSLNVSHSNGSLYLNFSYGNLIKDEKIIKKKKKKEKLASADIGLINTLGGFISDTTSPSFMICGKRFIKYNCKYNKKIAELNNEISNNAINWREIERVIRDENGDCILDKEENEIKEITKIPTEYNKLGKKLRSLKSTITEDRNNFFKSEFNKLSTHLVEYLDKINVTDFVGSKNLSFTKIKGSINLHKKTKQKFYQIPFGQLLNMIERKCGLKGINFHDIDEAHTSKTSCLSKNVNEMKELRKKSEKSLSTNVYGGKRVKRGFYKDFAYNILINADINGSINHLKVKFKKLNFEWLLQHKGKLCNPLKIKSDVDFIKLILNREAATTSLSDVSVDTRRITRNDQV
jgi:IS605 OrfB family transposase